MNVNLTAKLSKATLKYIENNFPQKIVNLIHSNY